MKLTIALLTAVAGLVGTCTAQIPSDYDYDSIDPNMVGWGSTNGIPRWDPTLNIHPGGFLGNAWSGDWREFPIEWLPGTNLIVYGSSQGLKLWDTEANELVGYYNNVTNGNWKVSGIAFDPSDVSKVIYTSSDGLFVWDTVANAGVGRYRNIEGDWTGHPIANHPTNPDYLLFTAGGQLRVWDTVFDLDQGLFGNRLDPHLNWDPEETITRMPLRIAAKDENLTLSISQNGESVTLSWPSEIGSFYQLHQAGVTNRRIWDFRAFGAPVQATGSNMEVTVSAPEKMSLFVIRRW